MVRLSTILGSLFVLQTGLGAAIDRRDGSPDYFSPYTQTLSELRLQNCSGSCDAGSWGRVEKDLLLGSNSLNTEWLSYKNSTNSSSFIVDIKVSTSDVDDYQYISNGIYVKYGSDISNAVTALDVLFGPDAVEPRPEWTLLDTPIQGSCVSGKEPKITFRTGPELNYQMEYPISLQLNEHGSFKILQVADLHFSTGSGKCLDPVPASSAEGCKADPRTIALIERVLDLENPDLIILTGDQVYGPTAPDAETALFKALNPFIKRKIPYAVVLGNHDQESSLTREQSMAISSNLPYSLAQVGDSALHGYGNYIITVGDRQEAKIGLYFLDSGDYNTDKLVSGYYDFLRQNQLTWLKSAAGNIQKADNYLSMGIFHISIAQYELDGDPYIGHEWETPTHQAKDIGARGVFGELGVNALTVGHDHLNEFCELDETDENSLWLCYGGGGGLGGYGSQADDYQRRFRTYQFDTTNGTLSTWKRRENDTTTILDYSILAEGGVNSFP